MALNYSKWDSLEEYDEVSDDSDDDQGSISRPKLPAGYLDKSNPNGKSTVISVPWEVSSGENKNKKGPSLFSLSMQAYVSVCDSV